METTTSRTGEESTAGRRTAGAGAPAGAVEGYLRADFPWYGLDGTHRGPRWLMQVGAGADGTVDHGSTGHGDPPSRNLEVKGARRFTAVVTVARRPERRSADDTGHLEATSVSSAAWLAGSGLLAGTWPTGIDHTLRQKWLDQQTALAWELADDLDGPAWASLTLPVDGRPTPFHYRESEYGWVLAGSAGGVHLGAYGRGMSAYGLGFSVIEDITAYAH
ncbi:hypothetical protein GQS52_08890 [Streptomyces sp. SCUT-3]|uniref:hypothetical protein n=1 Tax=Streptomyces TaxID=1883 RepID=UPI000CBBFE55|nr:MULTISPECIES: hypothetical protein [unclassified Streptomyces]MCZ2527939.1 hypothetical protein [Streptomyces sp. HB2AG]PLW66456.1 hypothetical protein C0036_22655 [Streptomyces sp. DJ]QMV21879.1 hypothetical protein GQS52_08890 [Streptomyces sp. SCUT-3]